MATKKEILGKLDRLIFKEGSLYFLIAKLIRNDFFDSPKKTTELIEKLKGISGKRIDSRIIQTYIKKFMEEDIISSFSIKGEKGNYWYISSLNEGEARSNVGLSKKEEKIAEQLFSDILIARLKPEFDIEIRYLHLVFGKSGTCTAFMIRKILEKLIFLVFAKHNLKHKLESKGELMGLEATINTAMATTIGGKPVLMPRTGREIKGIKFLGDSAAHNPLVNVDMKTIIPQMPFIITAYEELSKHL